MPGPTTEGPGGAVGTGPRPAESRGLRLARFVGVQEAGRVLRDFATYLPSQLVPAIAGFLVLPVLARKLAPTELGVLAIAQTLVTLGWIGVGSWLATAVIRQLPEHRERGTLDAFSGTLVRGLALSSVVLGLFTAALAGVGTFSAAVADNLALIAAATAGLVLQNIAVSLFAGSLRPRGYAIVDIAARTGGVGLGVALVFAGYKVSGYLFGLAVASLAVGALGLAAGWPRARVTCPAPRPGLDQWLGYGVPGSISAVATWALAFVDRYLLALLKDTGDVGIYTVGNVIGDKVVYIPATAFLTAAGPLLITAYEQRGRVEVERLMHAYTRVLLLIGLPIVAFAAAAADPIVSLVSARYDYSSAAPVVPIVAIGSLVYALSLIGYAGLIVAKRTWPMVYAGGLAVGVNIAANLALVPPLGIKGAAIATPIGMVAWLAATQVWSRRYASWRFPVATLVRAAVAAGLGYLAAFAVLDLTDSAGLEIGLAAGLVAVVYVLALAALGERRARRT